MDSFKKNEQIRKKFTEDCMIESRKPTEEEIEALAHEHRMIYGESAFNPYIDSIPITISIRTWNCINSMGIEGVGDLRSMTRADVLKYRNTGKKTLYEIEKILSCYGMSLKKHDPPSQSHSVR